MPRTASVPLIYVVDDEEGLTELYTIFLEPSGYRVSTFNDRADALAALKADHAKPDLLITDYHGLSMSVDRFMNLCLAVHPALRILMASGLNQTAARISQLKPDLFIQKPFTPEELRQAVKAVLSVTPIKHLNRSNT